MTGEPFRIDEAKTNNVIEMRKLDLESGLLGRFFGNAKNAPVSISGLTLLLLLVAGIVQTYVPGSMQAMEYWRLVVPVMTLILGYLIGHKS